MLHLGYICIDLLPHMLSVPNQIRPRPRPADGHDGSTALVAGDIGMAEGITRLSCWRFPELVLRPGGRYHVMDVLKSNLVERKDSEGSPIFQSVNDF